MSQCTTHHEQGEQSFGFLMICFYLAGMSCPTRAIWYQCSRSTLQKFLPSSFCSDNKADHPVASSVLCREISSSYSLCLTVIAFISSEGANWRHILWRLLCEILFLQEIICGTSATAQWPSRSVTPVPSCQYFADRVSAHHTTSRDYKNLVLGHQQFLVPAKFFNFLFIYFILSIFSVNPFQQNQDI